MFGIDREASNLNCALQVSSAAFFVLPAGSVVVVGAVVATETLGNFLSDSLVLCEISPATVAAASSSVVVVVVVVVFHQIQIRPRHCTKLFRHMKMLFQLFDTFPRCSLLLFPCHQPTPSNNLGWQAFLMLTF